MTRRQLAAADGARRRRARRGRARLSAPGAQPRDEINFWASATMDIEDGWKTFTKETGVDVAFTDNGNDPGPVVAKLAAGNANDVYDVGGLQGGSEKELAKQRPDCAVGHRARSRTMRASGNGRRTFRT